MTEGKVATPAGLCWAGLGWAGLGWACLQTEPQLGQSRTMLTGMEMENAAGTVRKWLDCITTADFGDIATNISEEEQKEFNDDGIAGDKINLFDSSVGNVSEVSEEDEKIVYKDGVKYIGCIEDNRPHGQGQLTLADGRLVR